MTKEVHQAVYLVEEVKKLYELNLSMLSNLRDKNRVLANMLDTTADHLAKKKAMMFKLYCPPTYRDFLEIYKRIKSGVVPNEVLDSTLERLNEIFWYLKYQNAYYCLYELYTGTSKIQYTESEVLKMASFTMQYIKIHPTGTKYMTISWRDEYYKVQFNYCNLYFKNEVKKTNRR